jgi:hypothetical protein
MSNWRWQDYLDVLIGAWIVASPWVFGFADTHPVATWSTVMLGVAIGVIAAIEMEFLSKIEEWLVVALGAWTIASPWVLGFAHLRGATISMVVAGIAVVGLTLWEIASGSAGSSRATTRTGSSGRRAGRWGSGRRSSRARARRRSSVSKPSVKRS